MYHRERERVTICCFDKPYYTTDSGTHFHKLLILFSSLRLTLCGIGGILLLSGLAVLTSIEQDDARHNFGHTGGIPPSTYKHEVVILLRYYLRLTIISSFPAFVLVIISRIDIIS